MPIELKAYQPVILTASHSISLRRTSVELLRQKIKFKFSEAEILRQYVEGFPQEWQNRPAVKMAKNILAGRYDRSQVEEVEAGFRLKGAQACTVMQQAVFGQEKLRDDARLALISDLTRLGYRVGLLAADPAELLAINTEFEKKAQAAGVAGRDIIYFSWPQDCDGQASLAFPRDLFTQLGDAVYTRPECGPVYDWGRFFAWAKGLGQKQSRFGIGGEVIIGKDHALLSDLYQPELAGNNEKYKGLTEFYDQLTIGRGEGLLQSLGYATFRVPTGWSDLLPRSVLEELGTTKRFFIPSDHVDMSAMLLPAERGLFFHAPYYQENRERLDPIVDKIRPAHFALLPEEDGFPVNSLPLPGGGVFMDAAARQSAALLRQMGIRVETTSQPWGGLTWGTVAGIHCSTNTVYLPKADRFTPAP
jgi:hypothetical protein